MFLDVLAIIAGLMGYAATVYGVYLISPIAALILGGAFAMWWSWYVTIGVNLPTKTHEKE